MVYTHGFAGVAGGLLVGIFANNADGGNEHEGLISGGGLHLLGWQALTALWVIVFSAIGTFILLKLVGLVVPLRMTDEEMETGRHRRPRPRGVPVRRALPRLPGWLPGASAGIGRRRLAPGGSAAHSIPKGTAPASSRGAVPVSLCRLGGVAHDSYPPPLATAQASSAPRNGARAT